MEGKILFARFFGGQKDWNDSRTTVLESKKLVLLKKILFLQADLIIKSFNL
jgi:hypothetical protein